MLHQHSFEPSPDLDRREADRRPIRFTASVEDAAGCAAPVEVTDISRQGFMAQCAAPLQIGSTIMFTAPNGETFPAEIRWVREDRIGCRFQQALDWEDVLGLGLEELGSDEIPGPEAAGALNS